MSKKNTDLMKRDDKGQPEFNKKYTRRFYLLLLAGVMVLIGIVGFIGYALTMNMVFGASAVVIGLGGGVLFYYQWNSKSGEVLTIEKFQSTIPENKVANSLNVYRDRVVFEYVDKPEGFPYECTNDHRKYFLNTSMENWNEKQTGLIPFTLPDNQYYDPQVFAERPLSLPATRKVMRRREKLSGAVKTAILAVVILILWILIVTTTGQTVAI